MQVLLIFLPITAERCRILPTTAESIQYTIILRLTRDITRHLCVFCLLSAVVVLFLSIHHKRFCHRLRNPICRNSRSTMNSGRNYRNIFLPQLRQYPYFLISKGISVPFLDALITQLHIGQTVYSLPNAVFLIIQFCSVISISAPSYWQTGKPP